MKPWTMPRGAKSDAAADRKRQLAAIHAAAAKLGMDTADKSPNSEYRTVLQAQGGHLSAADMDEPGRKRVLAYLQRQAGGGKQGRHTFSQAEWIDHLWGQLGAAGALRDPSPAGLADFLKARQGVESAAWLTGAQASQVIEALKAWKGRAKDQG